MPSSEDVVESTVRSLATNSGQSSEFTRRFQTLIKNIASRNYRDEDVERLIELVKQLEGDGA